MQGSPSNRLRSAKMKSTIGTHILGDLRMCESNYLFSLNMEKVKKDALEIIAKNNFTVLGSYFHRFDNESFTGIIALSESHVSMHTWPEIGVVNIDVYTCNYQNDNTASTRKVFDEIAEIFKPGQIDRQEIKR
jgi:S-adenosylmethionine decarboxylase